VQAEQPEDQRSAQNDCNQVGGKQDGGIASDEQVVIGKTNADHRQWRQQCSSDGNTGQRAGHIRSPHGIGRHHTGGQCNQQIQHIRIAARLDFHGRLKTGIQ
jgi:hypothetical protein